jgi:DNA modification methylase
MHTLTTPDDLKPASYNPRTITPEALAGLKASIVQFGDIAGITWNRRTGNLVTGHQRMRSLRALFGDGLRVEDDTLVAPDGTRYPVRVVDWDDAKEMAANIAANSQHIGGTFDDEKLAAMLDGMKDEEFFKELRFDLLVPENASASEELHAGLTDPEDVPEPPEEAVTKLGDLWILGAHRLMCGNSRKAEDVIKLMDGQRATLFATDPPYLVDYDGTNHPGKRKTANKDWSDTYHEWDASTQGRGLYDDFVRNAIDHAITPNAAWYCWHASRRQAMLEDVWTQAGAFVHQQIIWAKTRGVLTYSVLLWAHEPCFFGWVKGKKPRVQKLDANPTTVWHIPSSDVEVSDHPTPKPTLCFGIPMELHTLPGEICFEPFSGSGSQIMAAEQRGRRCFAMELTPIYVDQAVARWERFTGRRAERIQAD